MGMTIEEKIKTLIEMYHYIKGDTHFCGYIEEDATNALETAIDTMCKYQKIVEIFNYITDVGYSNDYLYDKISEVIADGNE